MRVVFAGTPQAAVPSLEALLASDHDVVAVLTRPPRPAGRRRRMTPSAVAEAAADLEILTPASIRDQEFVDRLRALAPDAVAIVAYGALIPAPLLTLPRHGWINLHFSLLPAWRGAAPVPAAIRAGDTVTGATTFRLEEGLDTGPVYGTITTDIGPTDTAGDLLERLAHAGADLLVATLDGLEAGTLVARPQPTDGISHAPKVDVADARIDWSLPAFVIDRRIRAATPEPGAWTDSAWGRLGIGPVTVGADMTLVPGELHVDRHRVLVGTGTEPVELGTVQPAGKRAMAAADWARGARPQPGQRFGDVAAAATAPASPAAPTATDAGTTGVTTPEDRP